MDQNYTGDGTFDPDPFVDELARFESLVYDAFDRGDSTTRFTSAVSNGDYLQQNASGFLEVAPAAYLLNHDEKVNLPASSWRTCEKNWLAIGLTPDHHDVIGGLVQTMADNGATGCDRCELVAQHHKDTPTWLFNKDPSGKLPLSVDQRLGLWTVCTQLGELAGWVGAPPVASLNMNAANCVPCPLHNRIDVTGNCAACPPNKIAVGNQCADCGTNQPSSTAEVCVVP